MSAGYRNVINDDLAISNLHRRPLAIKQPTELPRPAQDDFFGMCAALGVAAIVGFTVYCIFRYLF